MLKFIFRGEVAPYATSKHKSALLTNRLPCDFTSLTKKNSMPMWY